jgi:hypothetical protein
MVALRGSRQDRTLLIAVWVLTVVVLVLGGLAQAWPLLLWGGIGLLAAVFLTRIYLRDTRGPGAPGGGAGAGGGPNEQPADDSEDAEEPR